MNCDLLQRHVGALVDGELDPDSQLELEQHVAVCPPCRETCDFERSFKARIKESLGGVRAPESLRDKVCERIRATEKERTGAKWPLERLIVPIRPRYAIPIALVATAGLAFFGSSVNNGRLMGASTLPMFEDVVRLHASELPSDVQGPAPEGVTSYFRNKVEFPVRPAVFGGNGAQLVGARLSNVLDRRAAALFYNVNGRRVTVVVFRGEADDEGETTQMNGREVQIRRVGGYTVPVLSEDGVTYAFTGDLDRESMIRLVASARMRP